MRRLVRLRILSQVLFFCLFVWLVFTTEYRYDKNSESVSGWLKIFFDLNPLNLIGLAGVAGLIYKTLALGFILIVLTIVFGRFFCGWVCPLGSLNNFFSAFKPENAGKSILTRNVYKPYQKLKYYLLFFFAGMAILGSLQTGLLDPLSLLARSLGLVVFPALFLLLRMIFGWFLDSSVALLAAVGDGLYRLSEMLFLPPKQPLYNGVFWLAVLLAAVIAGNRIYTRFWCRALCPLGALLGIFAGFSIFGLKKDKAKCDDCGKCLLRCQGGDNPHRQLPHHRSECHLCLNCLEACPNGALSFGFYVDDPSLIKGPDLSRRKLIIGVFAGVAVVPVLRSGLDKSRHPYQSLIRPPGSLAEEEFLARCIRCGQCMKICPTNALHPAIGEAGWEGIFSPVLIPAIGYCEYTCVLCGHSCPTGAIRQLSQNEKTGDKQIPPLRIGTAFIDRGRCLPWASGKECIVCEEWCPTSPKAIRLEPVEQSQPDGRIIKLRRPYIIAEECIGCGACEYACPVQGDKAVYVRSVGESRNPKNEMLMHRPRRQ